MAVATNPEPASVYCAATGNRVTVAAGMVFEDDDPVVEEFPHLFESPIEDASAGPGKKRTVRRTSVKPS